MNTMPRHGMVVRSLAAMPAQMVQDAARQKRDFAFFFPAAHGPMQDRDELIALNERMRDDLSADNDSAVTPAGFTFFGQFVDHDLTLTAVKTEFAAQGPDFDEFRKDLPIGALDNVRTPEFELDSVFGRGPEGTADDGTAIAHFLYRDPPHDLRLRTGSDTHAAPWDLPREPTNADGFEVAIIGDPRNDENKLIAQVHGIFLRAYNRFYEHAAGSPTERYNEARRLLTETYHAILLHDYVRRFASKPVFENVLATRAARYRAIAHTKPDGRPEMPAEFAFALFRFGHSQVRDGYRLNATTGVPTFNDGAEDLSGLTRIRPGLAWDHRLFFDDRLGTAGHVTPAGLNHSRRIDTRLAQSLFRLKRPAVDPTMNERRLAARNMLRARAVGLASGEQAAQALGIAPLDPATLGVDDLPSIAGRTPLWYYILKEAELAGGEHLGTVGSIILAETILGILATAQGSSFRHNDWSTVPRSGITTMRQLADFAPA
jgi:hypothetical protein